jgi:hypothetical protein
MVGHLAQAGAGCVVCYREDRDAIVAAAREFGWEAEVFSRG